MKKKKKNRCQSLDGDGKQCNSVKGTKFCTFHGDSEITHPSSWVAVWLCEKHKWPDGDDLKKNISPQ